MNLLLRLSNYIARYAPSEKKLREYISRKKHTSNLEDLINDLGYDESMMVDMWLHTFLSISKWEREIREKLKKKWFPLKLIETKIEKIRQDLSDWENHKFLIERKIDDLIGRGKSKKMVYALLSPKYPYFRDQLKEALEWKDELNSFSKELEKYLQKYDISNFNEKSKLFAALQRKWFDYKDIQNALRMKAKWERK